MVIQILNENWKIFALGGTSSILLKLVPFQSSGLGTFCDHVIPNFISNFNNHYSDLSNEVYNVSVPQGGHYILSEICRSLMYRSGIFYRVSVQFFRWDTFF